MSIFQEKQRFSSVGSVLHQEPLTSSSRCLGGVEVRRLRPDPPLTWSVKNAHRHLNYLITKGGLELYDPGWWLITVMLFDHQPGDDRQAHICGGNHQAESRCNCQSRVCFVVWWVSLIMPCGANSMIENPRMDPEESESKGMLVSRILKQQDGWLLFVSDIVSDGYWWFIIGNQRYITLLMMVQFLALSYHSVWIFLKHGYTFQIAHFKHFTLGCPHLVTGN